MITLIAHMAINVFGHVIIRTRQLTINGDLVSGDIFCHSYYWLPSSS